MRTCRVLVALLAGLSVPALVAAQPAPKRVWIDVNFGVASSTASEETFVKLFTVAGDPAAKTATYPKPSTGAAFDFGGGYLFTPVIGVGISITGAAHQDVVDLFARVPHPFFFSAVGTGSDTSADELKRGEGGINIQAMFVPVRTPQLTLRVFGGPTYFRYRADMVRDVRYSQFAPSNSPTNTIVITGFEFVEVEGTGWGAHLGVDVGYFFSSAVGVGGFIRFSGGSVTVDEPMSGGEESIKVGGLQTGGGIRFRF